MKEIWKGTYMLYVYDKGINEQHIGEDKEQFMSKIWKERRQQRQKIMNIIMLTLFTQDQLILEYQLGRNWHK